MAVNLSWARDRIFEKPVALVFQNSIAEDAKQGAVCEHVKVSKKASERPKALNTVALLKHASSGMGMSPHETMNVAERSARRILCSATKNLLSDRLSNQTLHGRLHILSPDRSRHCQC